MKMRSLVCLAILFLTVMACNQPTVVEPENPAVESIFKREDAPTSTPKRQAPPNERHLVLLIDTMSTDRYSYLKVSEEDKEFWLATLKGSFKIGAEYVFERGLYKTNYYSTQFGRNFEEIYLVSDLRPLLGENQDQVMNEIFGKPARQFVGKQATESPVQKLEGGLRIKEIVAQAESLQGKELRLSAKVIKVNADIMDRHWLHLQDGSLDQFDLVCTSKTLVPVGHVVNLKATLSLNRDFGAGYQYDLILEDAEVIP